MHLAEGLHLRKPQDYRDKGQPCARKSGLMWFSCENLKFKFKKV
jgi:hypothetical protein